MIERGPRIGPRLRRVIAAGAAVVLITGVTLVVVPATAGAANPCAPLINPVACENSKSGTPQSVWDSGLGDVSIQGFATQMSVNLGGVEQFKINTSSTKYHIDIYRLGYYQGNGARLIATIQPSATLPQTQPSCLTDPTTELVDCGNWAVSASWTVPTTVVSGVYMAHLVRDDNTDDNQIPFVVRDDSSHSGMIYQTSDTTWQAYNTWGGNSLYTGANGRATKVSYNRPFATRTGDTNEDFLMSAEYPMIRFLEANGYDVSYQSGIDTDRSGSLLLNHKVFLSVGHDEYWSGAQRANVEAARSAGVNLAFFSGNEIFWKTRWEPSIDGSNTSYRTLVCYKESADNAKTDPTPTWTGTWMDPRFSPPSDGGRPQNALSGTLFGVQAANDAMQVPAADGKFRFWRNTSLATLAPGTTGTLPQGVLGYEWDTDPDNGFRPAGLFDLSSTTLAETQIAANYGTQFGAGTATHNMTEYRSSSGALVFSAGTIRWSWGLDATHDGIGPPANRDMQQATINLLADMGAQPGTIIAGLIAATQSADKTPPTAKITSPAAGATITNGNLLTVTGTATDAGGGIVAMVEVSLDGGTTWHRATGTSSWSYAGSLNGTGAETVQARAVDDSGNLQTPVASQPVTVQCPCSIFGLGSTPTVASSGDANAVEVGVKFSSDVNGWITGVRFYKSTANTGTHIGNLWSSAGQLLASATFTNESASGWQQVTFASPVAITSGTTYVASYYAPVGNYAEDDHYFTNATVAGPLHGLADAASGGNGVYRYGADAFPTGTYGAANYWVDPILSTTSPVDTVPPTVTSDTPLPGSSSVSTTTTLTATFSEPVQPATISFVVTNPSNVAVSGTSSYNSSTNTVTFTPSSALASGTVYTAKVSGAKDLAGNTQTAAAQWTFTTAVATNPPGVCPCSLWSDSTVPSVVTESDAHAVELGVRFTSDVGGSITGIRFYKGPKNTGVHTGTLWSSSGQKLATATFSSESTTGWQQVNFSSPVAVTAGTTYVASYHTTAGFYSQTTGQFSGQGVDNAPLHAPASVSGAANGLYIYGTGGFPTSSYAGSNYWVDVVFSPGSDTTPPSIVSRTPASGAVNVALTTTVSATMSEHLKAGTASLTLTGPSGAVAGTVAYSDPTLQVSFTPSAPLASGTNYTATLSGATDLAGNVASPVSWSFTTTGPPTCPCGLFSPTAVPIAATSTDTGSVELGVRFTTDTSGWVTGVRFYKGAGNTGVHTGSLWASDGTLLGTATFANETASGWQTVTFSAPIQITAGASYVASYHAPSGHYADDENFFANPLDNAPLHAPASGTLGNGVYRYGASGFPSQTYRATNYWVDVLFTTQSPVDTVPPQVSAVSPLAGSTSIPTTSVLTTTFNEAINPATLSFTLTGPGGAVATTTSYDSSSFTVTVTPTVALASSTAYTASVTVKDVAGNAMVTPYTWSFTSAAPAPTPGVCPCTLWADGTGPPQPDSGDGLAVEVGVKFRVDTAGFITGIRFYKAAANVGPHTASLWTGSGQLLATGTLGAESTAGWQQLTFSSPVAVAAATTYVASYHTSSGHYSVTAGGFSGVGVDSGPLHALADGVDGPDGLYLYGAGGFPTSSFAGSNYWVEPIFNLTAS